MVALVNLLVFAFASAISGPIADRIGPRKVIFAGVTVWSLATIGSALSQSFGCCSLCRAVVGVGEGAYGPSANALLCAAAPPESADARSASTTSAWRSARPAASCSATRWRRRWAGAACSGSPAGPRSCSPAAPRSWRHRRASSAPTKLPARAYLFAPTYLIALAGGILSTFGASALVVWAQSLIVGERHSRANVANIFMALVGIVLRHRRRRRRRLSG